MTPYERGYAAGLKAAAEVCRKLPRYNSVEIQTLHEELTQTILSLPIQGEATNPGEQVPDSARIGKSSPTTPARSGPCVMVPLSTVEWLCGEKPHPRTGLWFERPEGEGSYWWRSVLRKDIAAAKEEHDAHR